MSICKPRNILIVLLAVLCVFTTTLYYKGSINIYDLYVNNYVRGQFNKLFPGYTIKVSKTEVEKNDSGYHIVLSGVLVQNSSGKLVARIPQIIAVIHLKYLWFGFTLKQLYVMDPYVQLPFSDKSSIDLHRYPPLLIQASKYMHKVKIRNLIVNDVYLEGVNLDVISRYNSKSIIVSVKRFNQSAVQIEINLGSDITVSSHFTSIDLSSLHKLTSQYNLTLDGYSVLRFTNDGRLKSGSLDITDVKGVVFGHKSSENILSGQGKVKWIDGNLLYGDVEIITTERSITLSPEYRHDNKLMKFGIKIDKLSADELINFWPYEEGERALYWIIEHVQRGGFIMPSIMLQAVLDGGANNLNVTAYGSFTDGDVYIEDLPCKITGAIGNFLVDNDGVLVDSIVGNLCNIQVNNATVLVKDISEALPDIRVSGDATSSVGDLLPFAGLSEYAEEIQKIEGLASTKFDVTVIGEELSKNIDIELLNARAQKIYDQFNIDQLSANLSVVDDSWDLKIDSLLNDRGVKIRSRSTEGVINTNLSGQLQAAELSDWLGVKGVLVASGDLNIDLESKYIDSYLYISGKVNIKESAVELALLGFDKKPGDAGIMSVDAVVHNGDIVIPKITLRSESGTLSAHGAIKNGIVEHFTCDKISVGDNFVQLMYENINDVKKLVLNGDKIFFNTSGNKGLFDFTDHNFDIRAHINTLELNSGIPISNLSVSVKPGYKNSYILGNLGSQAKFIAENKGEEGLTIRTDNAGLFFSALGVTNSVNRGYMVIHSPPGSSKGVLILREFYLVGAPVLTQILSLASLRGIINTLNDEGLYFEQLKAPFVFKGNEVNFSESWIEGPSLGMSFEGQVNIEEQTADLVGHVVPIYYVNKLIWGIPVIGKILTGGKGRGIISIDYSLKRNKEGKNDISVNLISVLTPKILQRVLEIFKYI